MAASEYEWEFAEPPPIEFDCPICHNVLREPHLTSCCGSHFCQVCIEPIVREGKPCPNLECNERGFAAFLDKSVRRKIFGLDVKCPMWRRGCNWNGELAKRDGHLDGDCQFVDIDCSKSCGGRVQRRELPQHLERDCPKRHYACGYCGFEAIYEAVNSQHWPVCENFPLSCPNECGVEKVERRHFEQHLSECPLQVVECDFSYAGCTAKVRRQDLQQHMEESTQNHMKMLSHFTVETIKQLRAKLEEKDQQIAEIQKQSQKSLLESDKRITKLQEKLQRRELQAKDEKIHRDLEYQMREIQEQKNQQIADVQEALLQKNQQLTRITTQLQNDDEKISKLEDTLGEMKQENTTLKERVGILEITVASCHPFFQFSMPNFSCCKATKSWEWFSPSFYMCSYKMQLSVIANSAAGDGVTSVYVDVTSGEFDSTLTWPLKATVILQLIDPTGRHRPYVRSLEGEWGRVTSGEFQNGCSWRPFITHSELEKYLKEDTLHFQVVSVALM